MKDSFHPVTHRYNMNTKYLAYNKFIANATIFTGLGLHFSQTLEFVCSLFQPFDFILLLSGIC